jgi:hypothetical protein
MGMFRSADDEFLLCYDGKHSFLARAFTFNYTSWQNSASTLTNMVIRLEEQPLSNGKVLPSGWPYIHHTCFFSTRGSLKSDTLKPADWRRLSQAMRSGASGTDAGSAPTTQIYQLTKVEAMNHCCKRRRCTQ